MTEEQAQEEAEILYAKLVSGGDDAAKIQLIQAALLEAASAEDEDNKGIGAIIIAAVIAFAAGLILYGSGVNQYLSAGIGLVAWLGSMQWMSRYI